MSTSADTASLFRPFSFGQRELSNRIVMAPMTRQFSPGGIPGDNVAAYYRRRIEGGVGLIITEGTYVNHPAANGYANVPAFHGSASLDGWSRVVDTVHTAGGAIIPQLWHVGAVRRAGLEPDPSIPGYGPDAIVENGEEVVRRMSVADIHDVIAAFGQAAADAERVGFDGIEIHGAHGYLLDQFLWSQSNHRDDAYGGSLENRLRLPLEVVRAARAAVSSRFPIVFRFSQWKMGHYDAKIAETPEELKYVLTALADAGVDVFHASTRRFWEPGFPGSTDTLSAWVHKLSDKPVIAVGSVGLDKMFAPELFSSADTGLAQVTDPSKLTEAAQRGDFDLIAVGRALLSDPDWANKVRDGRWRDIVPFDKSVLGRLVM